MTTDEAIRIIKIVLVVAEEFEITVQGEEFTKEKCKEAVEIVTEALSSLEKPNKWIPVSEKYEHHIDHTDCIWYGGDSGCSVTCSQYRDGWNDAMDYIFKNGDGYRPYRRDKNG